ncbi:MAG: ABC transporter permease [Actinomycetales bacterium]|nr:ABC transporter permease [Actinomycetales bacterium]
MSAPALPAVSTPTAGGSGPRRAPRFAWWYVTEHLLRGMRGYLPTVVATAIGTPVVYLAVFGIGLGALITENVAPAGSAATTYLQFVAPALLCMSAFALASEEFSFGIALHLTWRKVFEGTRATPIASGQIADGFVAFVAIRMVITAGVYGAVIAAFGVVPLGAIPALVLTGVLGGLAVSPLAVYAARIQGESGQFAIVQRVIILPLTLFSGTLFPLTQLPIFLQPIGWISPLWHAAELGRFLAFGPSGQWVAALVHVAVLVAVAAGGWIGLRVVLTRRLER